MLRYYKILVGNKYAVSEYSYSSICEIAIGSVVEVEYGKRSVKNCTYYGICVCECGQEPGYVIKPIINVFNYVIDAKLIEFAKAVASYNLVSIGSIIEMILPSSVLKYKPLGLTYNVDGYVVSLDQLLKDGYRRSKLEKLEIAKNCIDQFEAHEITFSQDQNESIHEIEMLKNTCLLEGATGSGKTLVALKGACAHIKNTIDNQHGQKNFGHATASDQCANQECFLKSGINHDEKHIHFAQDKLAERCEGKILIITPEVSLGRNWAEIIHRHFGHFSCFYHYKVSDLYKSSVFDWAMSDQSGIIIGARSALFLPYKNLKMIIIDEEHSSSLKQERYPRYHARDMAILRAKAEGIPCLLLSATPSLETQYNVELGKYDYTKLLRKPEHGHASFEFVKQDKTQILSPVIVSQMHEAFENGRQVLLFLNRKGYAPYCICNSCNSVLRCCGCDVPQIFYSNHMVVCHKCSSTKKLPVVCPSCKNTTTWKFHGVGIEKLLEFTQEMFPEKIIKAVTSQTKEIDEYIEDLNNKKIDCLIATQVLAQGHDFKNISLAVIVDADMGLNSPDFRSSERMLQLWQQIRGRSARHDCPGKLIVQGLSQENRFIQLFNAPDPSKQLMEERRACGWPPFSKCAFIIVKSKHYKQAQVYFGKEIFHKLANSSKAGDIEFYGPLYIGKQDYVHEWRFLIKVPRNKRIDSVMHRIIGQLPKMAQISIEFEVDHYTFT